MTKGTPSMGKRGASKTHIICRRCGKYAYNATKRVCASCGFGFTAKWRNYSWIKVR